MTTYGPEVAFDLPSGDDRVQQLLVATSCEYGDTQRYRDGVGVDEDLRVALREAITAATHGRVDPSGFELHCINHSGARVEITGSFTPEEELSGDFESFATQEGGSA